MLEKISNTHYWTADMDAAVAFYSDTLGLTLRFRAGEDWAEFDVGGQTVALHGSRGHAAPTNGGTVVFEVEDLDRTKRALEERGVRFEGDPTEVPGFGRFASFRDPSGNLLQLFEPAPRAGGEARR